MKIMYSHRALLDTVNSLHHEFRDDGNNTLIVLGAWDTVSRADDAKNWYNGISRGYDKVIIFNQEPISCLGFDLWHDKYDTVLRLADEVWDYDERNIDWLAGKGIKASLHVLKPYMDWGRYAPVEKEIDVLFYGSDTPRRKTLVDFIRRKYRVEWVERTFGDCLDEYIIRSKVLLNLHVRDDSLQEQARMVKWLGAPCRIVSEKSWKNYLGVDEYEYYEIFAMFATGEAI